MALAKAVLAGTLSSSRAPVAELAAGALEARALAELDGPVDYIVIAVRPGAGARAVKALEDLDLGQPKNAPDRGLV